MGLSSAEIRGFSEALAPLFSDPAVPAFFRNPEAVLSAAGTCGTFDGMDLRHAPEALRAASFLHPELRVPGALLYMSDRGGFWRSSPGRTLADAYFPAPAADWDFPFAAAFSDQARLADLLDDFAWSAAAAALPPRAAAHRESLRFLGTVSAAGARIERRVAKSPRSYKGGSLDGFSYAGAGILYPERGVSAEEDWAFEQDRFGAEFGLAAGWAFEVGLGDDGPPKGLSPAEFSKAVGGPARELAGRLASGGCEDPLGVLYEAGRCRSMRVSAAAQLAERGEAGIGCPYARERDWTVPGGDPFANDVVGKALSYLSTVFRDNPAIPQAHLGSVSGIWRACGDSPRGAVLARSVLELPEFRSMHAAATGAVPPSLRVPHLAALLGAWARDGRADGAYAALVAADRAKAYACDARTASDFDGDAQRAAVRRLEPHYGFLSAHREKMAPVIKAGLDARIDPEILRLARERFGEDGAPLDPAACAAKAVEELSDPYLGEAPEACVDIADVAASLRISLGDIGFRDVPEPDAMAAAKSVALLLGDDVGPCLGRMRRLSGGGFLKEWAYPRKWDYDKDGEAEKLYASNLDKSAVTARDRETRARAWAPGYTDDPVIAKFRFEVLGVRSEDLDWEQPEGWEAHPCHPGALSAVKFAVGLSEARKAMAVEAVAVVGPAGRRSVRAGA